MKPAHVAALGRRLDRVDRPRVSSYSHHYSSSAASASERSSCSVIRSAPASPRAATKQRPAASVGSSRSERPTGQAFDHNVGAGSEHRQRGGTTGMRRGSFASGRRSSRGLDPPLTRRERHAVDAARCGSELRHGQADGAELRRRLALSGGAPQFRASRSKTLRRGASCSMSIRTMTRMPRRLAPRSPDLADGLRDRLACVAHLACSPAPRCSSTARLPRRLPLADDDGHQCLGLVDAGPAAAPRRPRRGGRSRPKGEASTPAPSGRPSSAPHASACTSSSKRCRPAPRDFDVAGIPILRSDLDLAETRTDPTFDSRVPEAAAYAEF